jgi:L-iditol 2-dehydrogenase
MSNPYLNRGRHLLRRHLLDTLDERGLVTGARAEILGPGRCVLRSFEESMPGPGQLLVETLHTAISSGTERAVYSKLQNVSASYPHVPGYCQVGRVVATGLGTSLALGQVVATGGAHASLHLTQSDRAVVVPPELPAELAVLMQLGLIALQGVRRACIEPGEHAIVFGCGVIGLIAAQLAEIAGANVTVVAKSKARLAVAQEAGLERQIALLDGSHLLDRLRSDVVIEATGDPAGLGQALTVAAPNARIVLLGSSRGVSHAVDLVRMQEVQCTILGAHSGAIPVADQAPGAWPWRREAETVLELAAQGGLRLAPLVTHRLAPDELPRFYEDLAAGRVRPVAALVDWSRPGPWQARIERPSPLRLFARGARRLVGRPRPEAPRFQHRRADGRTLRFGLVGCGEIAAETAAVIQKAANATISFTMDPNLDLARSLAAATEARVTDDIAELLASPEVDAVVISTPHHLHAPLSIQAAQAKKHVVVEKPMATSTIDARHMIEVARQAGVALTVAYCQRFDPRVQRAKRLIAAGALGRLIGTRISFGMSRSERYWTEGLTGRTASDWRAWRATAGGGVLIMNACHLLDYVFWLTGSDASDVVAHSATLVQSVEVEDSISMSYRYRNGALGTLEASTCVAGPVAFEQTLWGTTGQIWIGPGLRFWSKRVVEGYAAEQCHLVRDLPRGAERRHYFEAVSQALLDGQEPPITGSEAVRVQAAIEAAYVSADRGCTTVIPEPGAQPVPRSLEGRDPC